MIFVNFESAKSFINFWAFQEKTKQPIDVLR